MPESSAKGVKENSAVVCANSTPKRKEKKRKRDKASKEPDTPLNGEGSSKAKMENAAVKTGRSEDKRLNVERETNGMPEQASSTEVGADKGRKRRRKRSQPTIAQATVSPVGQEARPEHPEKGEEEVKTGEQADAVNLKPELAISTDHEEMKKYLDMRAPASAVSLDQQAVLETTSQSQAEKQREETSRARKERERARKKDEALQAVVKQLEIAKLSAEKEVEMLRKRIKELEQKTKKDGEDMEFKDAAIEKDVRVREQLKDAVGCGVCFETLNDPHILSCGHIACKGCLVNWFRTPGAYPSEVPEPIPEDMDLSYRTKTCHVCRTRVINRPVRMYHLQPILEPLGIDPHIPAASQQAEPGSDSDPWRNIFPADRTAYKIHDAGDMVDRCPVCLGEIDEDVCMNCDAEFSQQGDDAFVDDMSDGEMEAATQRMLDDVAETIRAGTAQRARHQVQAPPESEGSNAEGDDIRDRVRHRLDGTRSPPRVNRRGRRPSLRDGNSSELEIVSSDSSQTINTRGGIRGYSPLILRGPNAVAAHRRRVAEQQQRRADRGAARARNAARLERRQRRQDALPPGVTNFLDIYADDDDDDDDEDDEITNDEGDEELGERGDYPDNPSDGGDESMENEQDEEEYEDSFIDDGEVQDDFSGSDVDGEVSDRSVIRRDTRRASSRASSEMRRGEASDDGGQGVQSESEDDSDIGGQVELDEMRRRRALRFGGDGRNI